jgi:hypothetical protein
MSCGKAMFQLRPGTLSACETVRFGKFKFAP